MTPLERTRLEKAAADCGFELSPQWDGETVRMRSNQFPETVMVRILTDDEFEVSASNAVALPDGHLEGEPVRISGWQRLYALLDAASARARTLPNRIAQQFRVKVAQMPKTTEAERLVVQRVGQDLFRSALLDFWGGKCCVTALAVPQLLRASHIRPWSACETDEQRLDVFNGLLLSPNLDALFDGGWVTFQDDGHMLLCDELRVHARNTLGVAMPLVAQGLCREHLPYMAYHRTHVFRGANPLNS